jgi:hypothetical protein
MIRAYNHNISPGFVPAMAAFLNWGTKQTIPVTLIYDPQNPARCQTIFATDETAAGGGTLTIWAAGAAPFSVNCNVPALGTTEGPSLDLKAGTAPFPQGVVNRGPLPAFPPGSYDRDLWFQPPATADVRYWRCNFGGVTIPGLPWVDGMEDANYDRVLTGFFGRYTTDWQQVIIRTYRERGYTHFLRWVQDEMHVPGFSIAKYVSECQAIKAGGVPFIAHSFLSKTFSPQNPGSAYCHQQFDALIDALLAAGCLDCYTVGFELNAFTNDPASNDACIDYFTVERGLTEATGHPGYVHFYPGYTWQGTGARDRRSWWDLRRGKLTGLLYQSDPAWGVRDAQDRYKDTTDNPDEGFVGTDSGFGHPFDFVPLETQLERAFGDHADLDENDLDLMGYLSLCTTGGVPCMGFGCGCRRPDGSYV